MTTKKEQTEIMVLKAELAASRKAIEKSDYAITLADRLIERAYGSDTPKEWNKAVSAAQKSACKAVRADTTPGDETMSEFMRNERACMVQVDTTSSGHESVVRCGTIVETHDIFGAYDPTIRFDDGEVYTPSYPWLIKPIAEAIEHCEYLKNVHPSKAPYRISGEA